MKIKIAELNVDIANRGSYIEKLSEKYITEFNTPDISIKVTNEEIEEAQGQIKDLLYRHNLKKPGENALRHTARIKE